MGFRLPKNFLSAFIVLIFVASSAFSVNYVILKPDGTYHDAVKVDGVWKRADGSDDELPVVLPKHTQGYIAHLRYWDTPGGWYYPNRGAGSINMTWFSPPAACSLMLVSFFWYSSGDALIYVWDSPFPYVAGMQSSQLEDSMYKYWVYDTTIAHSVTGWTSMPTAIANGVPITSASSADGVTAWTDLDLTPFGGPFDIPEGKTFWLGYMITDTTFGGRPWALSEDMCCIDVPGRSWQYRTTRYDPPVDYYNFYCYSDLTGDWAFEAVVYIYGNPAPEISMDSLPDTYSTGPYPVKLEIKDKPNDVVTRAKVYWNINDGPGAPFDSAELTTVDSIQYTGTIGATASPGDTIYYYIEADDEQPKTAFLPPDGKFAPWNFIVREKVNGNLFVYGDENCDSVILDILDTLGFSYDIWDGDGSLTGRSYGSPDSSVINAGYNSIVWVTWSGLHLANAADWLMQYFDNGGNLFLSGTDAFSNYVGAYEHIVLDPNYPEHQLATDYFHFTEITDDFHSGKDTPAWLHGAEGDTISDPFYEDPILFNPAYTYSGQSDWMGKVTHDGSVTDIFFDESNVATGYKYEDAVKGYKYVFLYWNITALSDPDYDDTLGVFDFDAATEIIKRSLDWFGSLVGVEEQQSARSIIQKPRLFQNYPNPFTDRTSIQYAVASRQEKDKHLTTNYYLLTTLKIYDLTGRLVKTFDLKNKPTGSNGQSPYNQIVWNGMDDQGQKVAPGIYFYKLEVHTGSGTEDYKETRKMLLMR